MKFDKDLLNFIKSNKKARERLFKNRTIAYIMQQKYFPLKGIPLDKLESYVKIIGNSDRQWRKILEENEDLRGKDYNYKKIAEQKYQIELGYEAGYYNDIKYANKNN